MFKVVIVDDEDYGREAIRSAVEWLSLGLEVVGEASDGLQGLDMSLKLKPDIIISDVNMPGLNGIGLAAEIRRTIPNMRVIFISGYDEFSYVSDAIRIGVSAYLLKPIDRDELRTLLCEMADGLRTEQMLDRERRELKRQLDELQPLLRERFLLQLLKNSRMDSIYDQLNFLKMDIGFPPYVVLVFRFIKQHEWHAIEFEKREMIKLLVVNNTMEVLNQPYSVHCVWSMEDELSVIIGCRQGRNESEPLKVVEPAKRVLAEMMACSGVQATAGIGGFVADIGQIFSSYQQARQALTYRTYMGDSKVICWYDISGNEQAWDMVYEDWENAVIDAVRRGSPDEAAACVEQVFKTMVRNRSMKLSAIRAVAVSLLVASLRVVGELDEPTSLISETTNHGWWIMLDECDTAPEIAKVVAKACGHIADRVAEYHKSRAAAIVAQVKDIVNSRFSEKITLNKIADEIYLTPDWVGAVFKKETGQTFSEFLANTRMEKAMHFLQDFQLPIYEIAENVGYSNVSYFSSTFRNYTGMSPREYRNSLVNGRNVKKNEVVHT